MIIIPLTTELQKELDKWVYLGYTGNLTNGKQANFANKFTNDLAQAGTYAVIEICDAVNCTELRESAIDNYSYTFALKADKVKSLQEENELLKSKIEQLQKIINS